MPIEEPSVLDYVKSIFKDWKSFIRFIRSLFDATRRAEISRELEETHPAPEPELEPTPVSPVIPKRFPWRSLLALGLALLGQAMLEPPGREVEVGLTFYLIAIGLAVWACLRGEWTPAPLPAGESRPEPMIVRLVPLVLGLVFAVVAFADLGNNLFTWHNVLLWLAAIGFFVYAFRLRRPRRSPPKKDKSARRKELVGWGLVLAAVGLVLFFRVYRLSSVPLEPNSDHAEKILDVYDITQGQTHIFFPRNTGREGFQMYLTVAVAWLFGSGLSFLSLKIGTVICGLATLPYMYLLGRELGSKRIGLLAVLLTGIAYWPNVISRIGLRFTLYPLFVAPTLYYLLRGLRTSNRNDFILSGLFLGLGLHGYSPFRVVPVLVVIAVGLYALHPQSKGRRRDAIIWLTIVAVVALLVFLPLLRYMVDNPGGFFLRTLTRVGTLERPLPGPAWKIFFSNLWNALRMFNWDDGETWFHSVTHRPALDVVSGALFLLGVVLLLVRYIRRRHWLDLFLLVSIPVLELPSILSLAFPAENPVLNRTAGAVIPVFLVVALALDGLLTGLQSNLSRRMGVLAAGAVMGFLLLWSSIQNFDLIFNQYDMTYRQATWNSSEMGQVISDFRAEYATTDSLWIVPFPYWVDTRLPGVWAGIPNRDFALWPDNFSDSLSVPAPKLFIIKPEDNEAVNALRQLYPQGVLSSYTSKTPNHDFLIFFIPPQ